jgi:hypothetical protein
MTGRNGRGLRRTTALLTSAALLAGAAPSPARADDTSDPLYASIWNLRGAYGVPATVQFTLEVGDQHIYPLLNEQSYAAAAAHGLARIDLLADGQVVGTTTGAPWSITWDSGGFPEGPVLLTARAHDQAGRTRDLGIRSAVDHTPPTLRVEQNGYIRAGGVVGVDAADVSRIDRIDLLAGDRVVDSARISFTPLYWDRNAVDGPEKLTVRARDTAGNVTEYRRSVLVDSVAPAVTITPAAGAFLRGTSTFKITKLRDASGVGIFEVVIDGSAWSGEPSARRIVPVDTRRMPDGPQTAWTWVYDRAHNLTKSRRTVTIDNHAPTVAYLKAPRNNARVTKTFPVTAKAADRYRVARVQLLVNGKVAATDSTAGYRFTINPRKYGKKFTVQLRAYDWAGNVKYSGKRTYRR